MSGLRNKVVTISGCIWNEDTHTVAEALNNNANVLKNVCDKVEKLEEALNKYKLNDDFFIVKERQIKEGVIADIEALLPKCDREEGYICTLSHDDCFDCMYESLEKIEERIKILKQG